MKILLINTGQYTPLRGYNYPINVFQPAGIAYIANVLLRAGYSVAILDVLAEGYDHEEIKGEYKYIGLSKQEIKKRIKSFSPDVVGITIPFTAQARAGHEIAEVVRSVDSKITVAVGGSHPTIYPEIVLKDKNVDFVVIGEGEITFLELLKNINKNPNRFSEIEGLAYRNSKVKINKQRKPIKNLDNYQMAWDLLPMEKYFEAARKVRSSRSISTFGKRWATIFTSRGCPFSCTFCVGYAGMGRGWRPRSVKNIIEEMEFLIGKYKIDHFDIEDDNFTLEKDRTKELCDKIIDKGWLIGWSTPNGIRADTVDEELIEKMKQSGCVRTIVAPESGDQMVVDNLMKKKINLNKVRQVVQWCRKYSLSVDAFFLVGMPGESVKNVEKTIAYAKMLRKSGVDECIFGVVVPYRGTGVHEIAAKKGWLLSGKEDEELIAKLSKDEFLIETPYLSLRQIKELLKRANKVNSLIPLVRFKLIILMAIRTPRRFLSMLVSESKKRLGYSEGKLGV